MGVSARLVYSSISTTYRGKKLKVSKRHLESVHRSGLDPKREKITAIVIFSILSRDCVCTSRTQGGRRRYLVMLLSSTTAIVPLIGLSASAM